MKKQKQFFFYLMFIVSFSCLAGGSFTAKIKFPIGGFEVKSQEVRGAFKPVSGGFVAENIKVSVKKMTSDNETRDQHMLERFTKSKLIIIKKAIAKGGKGLAIIHMNGVKKKEAFTYTQKGSSLHLNLAIKLKEYGLKGLSYKDIVIKNEVSIMAQVDVKSL